MVYYVWILFGEIISKKMDVIFDWRDEPIKPLSTTIIKERGKMVEKK